MYKTTTWAVQVTPEEMKAALRLIRRDGQTSEQAARHLAAAQEKRERRAAKRRAQKERA